MWGYQMAMINDLILFLFAFLFVFVGLFLRLVYKEYPKHLGFTALMVCGSILVTFTFSLLEIIN